MAGIKFVSGVILKRHVQRVFYLEYPSTKPRTDFVKADRYLGGGGFLKAICSTYHGLKEC